MGRCHFLLILLVTVTGCPSSEAQVKTAVDSLLETLPSDARPESVISRLSLSMLNAAEAHDQARVHDRIAFAFKEMGFADSASVHAWNVLRLAPEDRVLCARAYALLGKVAYETNAWRRSAELYSYAGRLFELMGDKTGMLEALTYQARSDQQLEYWAASIEKYDLARDMALELQDAYAERELVFEMAGVFRSMGRFSDAEDYLNRSLQLSANDTMRLALIRRGLGALQEDRFQYREARTTYLGALKGVRSTDPFPFYLDLVRVNKLLAALDTASLYADSAETAALQSGSIRYLRDCYQSQYLLAEQLKDSANAFRYLLKYKVIDDSVRRQDADREVKNVRHELFLGASEAAVRTAELQGILADTRARNAQNEKTLTMLSIGLGIGLATFISLWYFTRRRSLERIRALDAERLEAIAKHTKVFAVLGKDLQGAVTNFENLTRSLPALLKEAKPGELKEMIANLHVSAQELHQQLRELMDWAASQTDTMPLRPQLFSCIRLAEETKAELQAWADEHAIVVELLVPEGVTAFADRLMIKIVLRTLLYNAIQESPEGQTVTLFSGRKEDLVTIGVRYTGAAPDNAALAWEEAPDAEERRVGLPLCRDLVRRNAGELFAESQQEGSATLYFTLPIQPVDNEI